MRLAKKGIPTVALVTEAFAGLAKTSAKANGMGSLPIVSLHRDLEYLSEERVQAETEKAFEEIVGKLVIRKPGLALGR